MNQILPESVIALCQLVRRVRRCDRAGGVIHEYRLVASVSAPTGRIREWDAAGHDVFVNFNNSAANAVRNARTLRTLPTKRPGKWL